MVVGRSRPAPVTEVAMARILSLCVVVAVADACGSPHRNGNDGGAACSASVICLQLLAGSLDGSGSADGIGSSALFSYPWAVAVDGTGNVYVADQGNNTIRKVTSAGVV